VRFQQLAGGKFIHCLIIKDSLKRASTKIPTIQNSYNQNKPALASLFRAGRKTALAAAIGWAASLTLQPN
jgi:hypothetical protein